MVVGKRHNTAAMTQVWGEYVGGMSGVCVGSGWHGCGWDDHGYEQCVGG